jgi:hypothetical protein
VNLKDYGISLEAGVQYRWFISIIQNPESRSEDVVAGGVIERCGFEECGTRIYEDWGCNKKQVVALEGDGLWYDAVSCLCDLIRSNPGDTTLRGMLDSLQRQAGTFFLDPN